MVSKSQFCVADDPSVAIRCVSYIQGCAKRVHRPPETAVLQSRSGLCIYAPFRRSIGTSRTPWSNQDKSTNQPTAAHRDTPRHTAAHRDTPRRIASAGNHPRSACICGQQASCTHSSPYCCLSCSCFIYPSYIASSAMRRLLVDSVCRRGATLPTSPTRCISSTCNQVKLTTQVRRQPMTSTIPPGVQLQARPGAGCAHHSLRSMGCPSPSPRL